jgi:hypothetical protein
MSGYVTEQIKENMHNQLVGAFSHVTMSHDDIELLAQHSESDLSSSIIQHGALKKGVKLQSHLSSVKNGGFETSKKENNTGSLNYALARQNVNAMQSVVQADNLADKFEQMTEDLAMNFAPSLQKIKHYAQSKVSAAEVEVISADASDDVTSAIDYHLKDGVDYALDVAPKNEDGTFMNAQEIAAAEAEHNVCLAPSATSVSAIYTDGMALNKYHQKLADPEARSSLTAGDVPEKILEQLRDDRMNSMYTDTLDQRMDAMDKTAEKHGFAAQDGKSASDVFEEARMSGDYNAVKMSAIFNERLAVNDTFAAQFNADFDANIDSHAQAALDAQLADIKNNGGEYTPPAQIDNDKLADFNQGVKNYSVNQAQLPVPNGPVNITPMISQSGDMNAAPETPKELPVISPLTPPTAPNGFAP